MLFVKIKPSIYPERIIILFEKGLLNFYNKKYNDTVNIFNSIIEYVQEPIKSRIKYLRGISYAKLYKFEKASLDCCELNSPKISYPFKYIHLMRGVIFDQELNYLKALHSFERAIKYDPEVIYEEEYLLDHLSFDTIKLLNQSLILDLKGKPLPQKKRINYYQSSLFSLEYKEIPF